MTRVSIATLLLAACSGKAAPPAPVTVVADAAPDGPAPVDRAALQKLWPDGCFALRDRTGQIVVTDEVACATPRRPYSTFKIANALIAVDAGLLAGPDAPLTWNKQAIPDGPDILVGWRHPHTLRTGIRVSSVPHFRTLALQLGEARMHAGLEKLHYGNRDMAGGLDRFWLVRGGLRISAREQLSLVEGLARGTLAVTPHAQETVREITELAYASARHHLHGKTGTGPNEEGRAGHLLWQVGYIVDGDAIVPYAGWYESADTNFDLTVGRAQRETKIRALFDALQLFPATATSRDAPP